MIDAFGRKGDKLMRFGNYEKIKKIRKTESVLKKIHDGIKLYCSNSDCKNTVVLKPDELNGAIMCTKCNAGFFVKEKPESKKSEEMKSKTVKNNKKQKDRR